MPGLVQQKPWVVQKYGGTSLGKLLATITGSIIPLYLEKQRVAVVCSAISGTSKSFGTTSLLLQAIGYTTGSGASQELLNETIDTIRDEHLKVSERLFVGTEEMNHLSLRKELDDGIKDDCESVRSFLAAAQTIGEISAKSRDRIIATGEKLACRIVVASLKNEGVEAELVSLHDIVAEAYGKDPYNQTRAYDDLGSQFFHALASIIGLRMKACGNAVPVITGFFGSMPYSLLQSVGRGYSDLCAAMCAAGVSAIELQIWKEVDGIFTADPRRVPSARLLATVTLEEASELTYYGSEVIHPLTMEQIRNANIPLRLKNVKNPAGCGTIIYPSLAYGKAPPTPPSSGMITPDPNVNMDAALLPNVSSFMNANGYYGESNHRRAPTALTTKDSIVLLNIQSNRQTKSHGFLAQVFHCLDQRNIIVDLITSSEQNVSLALSVLEHPEELQRLVVELEKYGRVSVLRDLSIISVIGHKMRNMVGINGQIFSNLAKGGVNIYFVGQGASEINVSIFKTALLIIFQVRGPEGRCSTRNRHFACRRPRHTKD
ncbi:Aspartate kinase [Hyphodiscus hymeniophilus]|uniref:Aspartokinase n=1 Tax=Hyphodiscus hymeniophilus TaxID=353542 RepID=A0A9P6VEW0_9HELO|nr:Aspartate kinase [Hyphodiscus hymeniophilus]